MDTRIHGVDPVTFEILSHRLHQVTREMGITLERTGGTVNTTQQRDYMASLYRPDGDILSAGATLGQHVVCASYAVKRIIERFPPDENLRGRRLPAERSLPRRHPPVGHLRGLADPP